jgi:hypothetical protein
MVSEGECSRFSPARLPSFDGAKWALFLALILGLLVHNHFVSSLWVRQPESVASTFQFYDPILQKSLCVFTETDSDTIFSTSESDMSRTAIGEKILSRPQTTWRSIT